MTTTLVVFTDTALCDGCGQEMTVYTDGITAYAESPDRIAEVTTLLRDGTRIEAACPRRRAGMATCHGVYAWDLAAEGGWVAEPASIAALAGAELLDVA